MTWPRLAASLLVAAALAAGGVHLRAAARERAAEAAYPPEGRFLQVAGRRVHAVVMGQGPDLVLIHGSSGNTRDFTQGLAQALAADYRVIVFDRPGLGWSERLPKGAETIHDQAAHLRAAAAMLGADRPVVLGASYGGSVALAWAIDAPESLAAVVSLAGPSHPWPTPLPWLYRVNSNPLGGVLLAPLITAFVGQDRVAREVAEIFLPQKMPPGYVQAIGTGLTLRRASLRANAVHRASLLAEITALAPRYGELSVPLEIVHGDADTTVSILLHAHRMIEATDMARLTTLKGIGHMPHHVAQADVIAAIHRAATRAGLR